MKGPHGIHCQDIWYRDESFLLPTAIIPSDPTVSHVLMSFHCFVITNAGTHPQPCPSVSSCMLLIRWQLW